MRGVLLGLGSNIEPERYLPEALDRIGLLLTVEAISSTYVSAAVASPGSPDFHNAVLSVSTELTPAALKWEVLRPLEAELGRRRSAEKSAPRTIDLDLVMFGSLVLEDPAAGLRLPHPDLLTMAYVAVPAAEIAPQTLHPETGETLQTIARRLLAAGAGPVVRLGSRPSPPRG